MLFTLLSFGAVAASPTADPSPSCFATAEAAFPQASIEVTVDGLQVVAPTADLDAVFAAVASAANGADISLPRNTSGTQAIQQAIECIFDAEAITWSAVRINQQFESLRVRPAGGMRYVRNGQTVTLNRVTLEGSATLPLIVFSAASAPHQACLAAALTALPRTGTADYWWSAAAQPATGQTCAGSHCTECTFDSDGWGCNNCEKPGPTESASAACNHSSTTSNPTFDTAAILNWS